MSSNTIALVTRKLAKQPAFLAAFGVLFTAAVSLNGATQFMQLHFKKQPVPLARSLDTIPDKLVAVDDKTGTWIRVSKDQLSEDMEQALGTTQYVMRYYIRRGALSLEDQKRLEDVRDRDPAKVLEELAKLRATYGLKLERSIVSFAVTYYTGKADTVAHIPERCYTADGYEPTGSDTLAWALGGNRSVDVRFISFEDQSGAQKVKKNVAYFFNCNGEYASDPYKVRIRLQNLREKFGYYAKVEMMVQENDAEAAKATMRDFLSSALPEVEKCLPDWQAVTAAARAK